MSTHQSDKKKVQKASTRAQKARQARVKRTVTRKADITPATTPVSLPPTTNSLLDVFSTLAGPVAMLMLPLSLEKKRERLRQLSIALEYADDDGGDDDDISAATDSDE